MEHGRLFTDSNCVEWEVYDESEWSYQEFVASYKGSGEWRHSYLTR